MGKDTSDTLNYTTQNEFNNILGNQLKCKNWVLATNDGSTIPNYDTCTGIAVTTSGTLTLLDYDGTELPLGTVDASPSPYPYVPHAIKSGSTAIVYLLY